MPKTRPEGVAVSTYRYLRAAIPVLVVGLLTSVVRQIAQNTDCFLGSISAYYYTPARPVFVAALCTIGALLIINHGNSAAEDHALDLSGFLAFLVAFVPTPLTPTTLPTTRASCGRSLLPGVDVIEAAIDNNVFTVLVTAALVLALMWWAGRATSTRRRPMSGRLGARSLGVASVALAAIWAVFLLAPAAFQRNAHLISAVTLFLGVAAVVALNALRSLARLAGAPIPQDRYRRVYLAVLAAMTLTAVVALAALLLTDLDHVVFWLESLLIGEFAVFWIVQTLELQDASDRGVMQSTQAAGA